MKVDVTKLGVIGIDRIVLSNFKIQNFEELEKKEIINKLEHIQRFEIKQKTFHLIYSEVIQADGESYNYATLEFNPNKIMYEHNIYNSSKKNMMECLEHIVSILATDNIVVDLKEAKIKEIELNITLDIAYETLDEIILLILKANKNKAIGVYSVGESYIPTKIKQDRCIYINTNTTSKDVTGKIIKIYDKTFEMYQKNNTSLDINLTRVEVLFGRDYYRNTVERLGVDNSLVSFLSSEIMEKIFFQAIETELKIKPFKEIKKIKSNLEKNFNNFRRNERAKRKERQKLKKLNKDIPKYLKEERGVFEYLRRESWIFDYEFLFEIVKKNVISKHQKDYERQIIKKYLNINNQQRLNNFLNLIFFTD